MISLNACRLIQTPDPHLLYRVCGLNITFPGGAFGDSGALVAYAKSGSRHVARVYTASNPYLGAFIPATDIKTAFDNVREGGRQTQAFSRFWGTRSGNLRPATRACDPPGC